MLRPNIRIKNGLRSFALSLSYFFITYKMYCTIELAKLLSLDFKVHLRYKITIYKGRCETLN